MFLSQFPNATRRALGRTGRSPPFSLNISFLLGLPAQQARKARSPLINLLQCFLRVVVMKDLINMVLVIAIVVVI